MPFFCDKKHNKHQEKTLTCSASLTSFTNYCIIWQEVGYVRHSLVLVLHLLSMALCRRQACPLCSAKLSGHLKNHLLPPFYLSRQDFSFFAQFPAHSCTERSLLNSQQTLLQFDWMKPQWIERQGDHRETTQRRD